MGAATFAGKVEKGNRVVLPQTHYNQTNREEMPPCHRRVASMAITRAGKDVRLRRFSTGDARLSSPGANPPPATEAALGKSTLLSKNSRVATTSTPLRLESAWNSGCDASSGELRINACKTLHRFSAWQRADHAAWVGRLLVG